MNLIINTIEIALFIVLPLILFYQRSHWNFKTWIFLIPVLYLIWYLTYGMMHELCHLAAVKLSGKEIYEVQLIPRFWQGEFGAGFVEYDFQGDTRDFFIILAPYARDVVFLAAGYFFIRKKWTQKAFWTGLVLVLLIFSPLYDLLDNYLAYLIWQMNDFNALAVSSSRWLSHGMGIVLTFFAIFITIRVLKEAKVYPQLNE
ncbi:MAG: hypothetical protein V2I46_08670 [Bacteroides sp.]|jgi:hypothetical protein|nr:hypothetical protein [Bacteroides sp.]